MRRERRRKGIAVAAAVAVISVGQFGVSAAPPSDLAADNAAGLAFRGDDLIVAESGKGRVLAIAPDGTSTTLADGLVPGVFTRGATGVATDANGTVYVAQAEAGTVSFLRSDGTSGVYAQGLGVPNGIAFDASGTLFVADHAGKRVLAVSASREITTAASGFAQAPFGLAFDPAGVLHVSTQRDGKVWLVDGDAAAQVASVAGTAEGLAFDEQGRLYVGDGSRGEVVRFESGGPVVVGSGLSGPLNLAFFESGLFVAAQGEGSGSVRDRVVRLEAGARGLPLAAPDLDPTALEEATAVAHRGGGVALDPAPHLGMLPEGTMTFSGLGAFEPTVGRTHSGAVFYNPKPTAGINTQHVMRSTDEGKTWEDVSPGVPPNVIVPPTDLDPYIYTDRDTGRLYTIQLYVGCSYLSYSDDDGETWIQNPLACGVPVNDHQTFYTGPTTTLPTVGYDNAAYYCWNAIAYSGCSRSLNGGLTFEPTALPFPPGGCAGLTGHVTVGPDGTVYLPKGDCSGGPQVAVSTDDGLSWSRVQVAPGFQSNEHESHVAVDKAGNAYFLWESGNLPYIAVSEDKGQTWSQPIMVGAPGVTDIWGPSIAAGDDGKISIFYTGATSDCCYSGRQGGEKMWNAYATISLDAHEADPTFFSTTFNDPIDPLRRGTCGPGRCGGRPTSFGDFLEVYVDHTGKTWAAIVDTCVSSCANLGLSGSNNAERGMVGQLVRGPKLIGEGMLTPPSWYEG